MNTPIYNKLKEYQEKQRISFAMPGHKNGRGLVSELYKCDVTELVSTLDLNGQSSDVKQANRLLADLYGADTSFILTGGSTLGVQAMLSSVLAPGDTLLAGADCHMSVINTCAVCGFKIRLVPMRYNERFGVPTVNEEFDITPDIKAVLMTSPNYYGIAKDAESLAAQCHAAGVPLLVDEAHGAHFMSLHFPQTAVRYADMVCQSAHKTLNALTGAAYLHVNGGLIDINRVNRALHSFGTSSPSYPIAASADIARAELETTDHREIIKGCIELKKELEKLELGVLENDDRTRVVINFNEYELSGFEVSEMLSERFGIDVEMADLFNIVLIVTSYNNRTDIKKLIEACGVITTGAERRRTKPAFIPPAAIRDIISPSEGWYKKTEFVPIDESAGRIAGTVISSYPPGTAIVVTGETIRKESIEYIRSLIAAGAVLTGIKDNKVEVV
ncbi:MAG: aminotransferase class V-fold PLP-dependent enzyme [Clostridia bacterium]|nr:aminotransferase class V-fold PLP-dependent enzyme [Clostridia bacterium]